MSAPRPKRPKILPRPPPAVVAPAPKPPRPIKRRPPPAKAARDISNYRQENGGSTPISVPDSSDGLPQQEDDDDEELEEVAIPSAAGPSSLAGHTVGSRATTAIGTSPGAFDSSAAGDDAMTLDEDEENSSQASDDGGVIHLEIGGETPEEKAKRIAWAMRKKPMTSKDRAMRLEAHKMHVIALLASSRIRNRWCNNILLKARLLSLLPHPLQSAFNIPPSRFPDRAQRSRLFFDALQSLATWWSQSFFDVSDDTLGLRTRPWDEVQQIVDSLPRLTRRDLLTHSFGSHGDSPEEMDKMAQKAGGERLRSPNSLMKKVLQQEGSRDVMAQLFVALARACGLGARLVTSLQAVPWRAEKSTAPKKKKGAGRNGQTMASRQGNGPPSDDDEDEEDDLEEVPIPGDVDSDAPKGSGKPKGKRPTMRQAGRRRHIDPADVYRLRAPKPPPKTVASPSPARPKRPELLSSQPPVFWCEVYSRSDQRWIPVDPVRGTIRKKTHFEPVSDNGTVRMLYVVAFEEDGYARDVTLRYTKNFGAKTSKLRVPPRKDEEDWWGEVVGFLQRPNRLQRDELEDAELETSQFSEGMPLHMNGFKDHPVYVLERHLKREEVITPKREIGRFKGEPVYRRSNVVSCKTAENWMRMGRRVKEKQEPLKWVKQRAVTLQKRRAQEQALQERGEAIQQGLYAEYQTEVYLPPPIEDSTIPQNSFGNIDLYADTMLPVGAVHLPYKGIAKVAKALGISYAEACTGFEFKKQRAIPVITGIVVAEENEAMVLDAYWESAAAAENRERMKKEERALKRWVKLINGLRVRNRLQQEYGDSEQLQEASLNPLADPTQPSKAKPKKSAVQAIALAGKDDKAAWETQAREQSPKMFEGEATEVEAEDEVEMDGVEDLPAPPRAHRGSQRKASIQSAASASGRQLRNHRSNGSSKG